MPKALKIYIAGKVADDSSFGKRHWRDEFVAELAKLSGMEFISFDPAKPNKNYDNPESVFASDVHMIYSADVIVAYLSDDVSVGTSQEILVAKYFKKPVIALVPAGSRFNSPKKVDGKLVKNYKHPFVYSTCDVVCPDIKAVASALKNLKKINPKTIDLIGDANQMFIEKHLKKDAYFTKLIKD